MATLNVQVFLFGGENDSLQPSFLGDTWQWGGSLWQQDSTSTSPSARRQFGMASLNGKITLFGGDVLPGAAGDTWEWDGTTWTLRNVAGPGPRFGHAMATR